MLTDSHCHLDHFTPMELPGLLSRAREAGVARLLTIGTRLSRAHEQRALAAADPAVWCTIGTHPDNAAEETLPEPEALASAVAADPRIVGLGESGIDHFRGIEHAEAQAESFRRHIRAARLAGVPVVVHSRAADEATLAVLREEHAAGGPFDFLLHCFAGGRALAEGGIALGGHVSFSGILTFPKSSELRDIARDLPLDRLLVETDAPFLAPVPHRGKRNEPAYVAHTARVLAEVRGLDEAALAEATSANFSRLFRKVSA